MKRLVLTVFLMWLFHQQAISHPNRDDGPLDARISSVSIANASIVDALKEIRNQAGLRQVVFSLEVAPFTAAPEKNLDVRLSGGTVGQVLTEIVSQDPRYTCLRYWILA